MIVLEKGIWLILTALMAAALLLSGSILSLALLLALLAVPAVSALCSLLARRQLKLSLSGPVNCAKGQRAAVSVTVENGSALPLPAIGLWLEVKNLLTGETQTVLRRTAALPRGCGCAQVELSSRFCGRVQVRVQRVRLYDCFWLIPVRCGASAAAAFTVQPDTFPLEVTILADAGCPEDSEVYSQEKPGADLTETFQVRDYREGDSIRQIHWKLTTKLDRLISRDPSLPVTRSVVVLWERRSVAGPAGQDAQAEIAVSLCRALLAQGVQFRAVWSEDGAASLAQEIRSMDDLIGLMPRLLSAAPYAEGLSSAEAFCRTAEEPAAHIVYIAESVPPEAEPLKDLGRVTALLSGAETAAPEGFAVYALSAADEASRLMELEI